MKFSNLSFSSIPALKLSSLWAYNAYRVLSEISSRALDRIFFPHINVVYVIKNKIIKKK